MQANGAGVSETPEKRAGDSSTGHRGPRCRASGTSPAEIFAPFSAFACRAGVSDDSENNPLASHKRLTSSACHHSLCVRLCPSGHARRGNTLRERSSSAKKFLTMPATGVLQNESTGSRNHSRRRTVSVRRLRYGYRTPFQQWLSNNMALTASAANLARYPLGIRRGKVMKSKWKMI